MDLPEEVLRHVLRQLSKGPDPADVDLSFRALQLTSKALTTASNSERASIILNHDQLENAIPYLPRLTRLKAVTIMPAGGVLTEDALSVFSHHIPLLISLTLQTHYFSLDSDMQAVGAADLVLPCRGTLTHLELRNCTLMKSGPSTINLESWSLDLPLLTSFVMISDGNLLSLDLSRCPLLRDLELEVPSLATLGGLSGKQSLRTLSCSLSPDLVAGDVSGCSQLAALTLDRTPSLVSLDVSGCTALQILNLNECTRLLNVNISECGSLESLTCMHSSSLESLDIAQCSKLHTLVCTNNLSLTAMTFLNIDNNSLERLTCSRNPHLAALDLSGLYAAQEMTIVDNNTLASLSGVGLLSLHKFTCERNAALVNLQLTGSVALRELSCRDNVELTSMDVSGSVRLRTLTCLYNHSLSSLNLLGCRSLWGLDTRGCNNLKIVDISTCRSLGRVQGHRYTRGLNVLRGRYDSN